MNITDWITLAAVLVALGIGISFIIQTQKLQVRERKERLLNEIIDWAIEVTKCEILMDVADLLYMENSKKQPILSFILTDKEHFKYNELKRKSVHIIKISLPFGRDLQIDIAKLEKYLGVHLELLKQLKSAILNGKDKEIIVSINEKLDNNKILLSNLQK